MRPKFSLWSDYGCPGRMYRPSASRRHALRTGSLTFLVIILGAATFSGISRIFPQIFEAPTHSKIPPFAAKQPDIVAVPLGTPPTGETAGSALAPELSQPPATPSPLEPSRRIAALPTEAEAQPKASARRVKKPKIVKKVARVERHRREFVGTFAQYEEWGWPWRRELPRN